jgi:hypothetical protein
MRYIHSLLRGLGMVDQHYSSDVRDFVDAQWCRRFESLRLMRMAVSYFRYGPQTRPDIPSYDHIGYALAECKAYLSDGNQEHLLDAANLLMLEFMRPCCHAAPHLSPTDGQSYEATR